MIRMSKHRSYKYNHGLSNIELIGRKYDFGGPSLQVVNGDSVVQIRYLVVPGSLSIYKNLMRKER